MIVTTAIMVLLLSDYSPVGSNSPVGMTRQPVLNLGVIGLGPDWGSRYAPALQALNDRTRVKVVYDTTAARTEEAAVAFQAIAAHGVRQVLSTESLDAIVLLSLGWQGDWLLERLAQTELPTFVSTPVLRQSTARVTLDRLSMVARNVVVPEQPIRYCPSMLRLRELMATQIGPVERVSIDLRIAQIALGERVQLSDLLSWCCVTFGLRADHATPAAVDETAEDVGITRTTVPSRNGRPVELEIRPSTTTLPPGTDLPEMRHPFCSVFSREGRVDLLGRQELQWDVGEGPVTERLAGERSAIDVMLDHFAAPSRRRTRPGRRPRRSSLRRTLGVDRARV